MLARLNEALEECKAEKAIAESVDFEAEIKNELALAEAKIRAEYDARKAEGVRDCDYQIRALEKLIAKELAAIEATLAADTAVADVPVMAGEFRGTV